MGYGPRKRRFIARNPCCAHCGTGDELTLDHVIPVSRGGAENAVSNWQVLCKPCNGKKAAKPDSRGTRGKLREARTR